MLMRDRYEGNFRAGGVMAAEVCIGCLDAYVVRITGTTVVVVVLFFIKLKSDIGTFSKTEVKHRQ